MAPDGTSFITSVGTHDSTAYIHDDAGEHPISSQGEIGRTVAAGTRERIRKAGTAFSSDGKSLYCLIAKGEATGGELWVKRLDSGALERILPGYVMEEFSVSRDGKQIAFTTSDDKEHSGLWVAATDLRSSPRHIESSATEDQPSFLPDGDLLFRANEGGANFLYRMHPDGSNRRKVSPQHILDFMSLSPDGRWAVVQTPDSDKEYTYSLFALPVEGGPPVRICVNICLPTWDMRGEFMYMSFFVQSDPNTYALAIQPSTGLPELPASVISGVEDLKKLKSAVVIPHLVDTAYSQSLYTYTVQSTYRNLYRIPLQ